jgi:N-acetylglucosamine repressor
MDKQSVSNQEVKKINRNKIYRLINERERVSKPEIASILGVSMPTVLQNVNELLERGLVAEVGAYESTGGRKAKVLAPVYNACYAIGIDITQNHISLVLTDLSGNVLSHARMYKPFADLDSYYLELGEIAYKFLADTRRPNEQFLGFGLAVPGIVMSGSQMITYSHALRIANVPSSTFSQAFKHPCIFTNDANAAMVAEMFHHPEKVTAVYLSLSNSVGGSIFAEKISGFSGQKVFDNLFLGDNFRSGEFGHMTLYPGGQPCYCGKLGCVDTYCSAKVLASSADGKLDNFFKRLKIDPSLQRIWDEYLDHLAIVINSLRMAFDCQIIIGGYVGSYIEPYIDTLRELTAKRNTFGPDASFIKPCRFKTEASALGAALRHVDNFISSI